MKQSDSKVGHAEKFSGPVNDRISARPGMTSAVENAK